MRKIAGLGCLGSVGLTACYVLDVLALVIMPAYAVAETAFQLLMFAPQIQAWALARPSYRPLLSPNASQSQYAPCPDRNTALGSRIAQRPSASHCRTSKWRWMPSAFPVSPV
jgi:hypothetical protein